MSQEDSDNFYLQQISEARESQCDESVPQSLVPLLSSRSNSPEVSESGEKEEEQIAENSHNESNSHEVHESEEKTGQDVEETKSPSRLKTSPDSGEDWPTLTSTLQ